MELPFPYHKEVVAADGISDFPDGTYETLLDKTRIVMI